MSEKNFFYSNNILFIIMIFLYLQMTASWMAASQIAAPQMAAFQIAALQIVTFQMATSDPSLCKTLLGEAGCLGNPNFTHWLPKHPAF